MRNSEKTAVLVVASSVILVFGRTHWAAEQSTLSDRYDCGAKALYILFRLEGFSRTLDEAGKQIDAAPEGHSMAELRDIARTHGLYLDGVRIGKTVPRDRPSLVYIRRGNHGHYLIVRPVGHTGRLVQTIDGADLPEVVEASELCASPGWTGLALVPRRTDWFARALVAVCFGVLVVGLLGVALRLRSLSGRSEGIPTPKRQ
jgi:hypothetical protein